MLSRGWKKVSRDRERGEAGWTPAGARAELGGVALAPGRDVPADAERGVVCICAWCGEWIEGRAPEGATTGMVSLRISHGMCRRCRF